MKLYFDLCALKRPFDDRAQKRIDQEAAAVIELLELVAAGKHALVWSAALVFANDADPDPDVRDSVARLGVLASEQMPDVAIARKRAERFEYLGLRPLDAMHLALAESARWRRPVPPARPPPAHFGSGRESATIPSGDQPW